MIYLDNAATTVVTQEIADLVLKYMTIQYGNTSSLHKHGLEAEKALKNAKGLIAKHLGCRPEQLTATSGGTEGNNWVIQSVCSGTPGHIIVSSVEHASVLEPIRALERAGWDVTYLPVDLYGAVAVSDVLSAVTENTKLISIMMVNNELGTISPIVEIAQALKTIGYQGAFHTDATQAVGKITLRCNDIGVDYLTLSAHKCHGPKGIGLLFDRRVKSLKPLIYGGGQEQGQRSGTHNLPGIVGMAKAIELADRSIEANWDHINHLRGVLVERLEILEGVVLISAPPAKMPGYRRHAHQLHSQLTESVPHIVSLGFKDVKSEVLLHSLEAKGIMVSSGSACNSNKKETRSHVIIGINLSRDLSDGVIRVSLSKLSKLEDIEVLLEALQQILPTIRQSKKKA